MDSTPSVSTPTSLGYNFPARQSHDLLYSGYPKRAHATTELTSDDLFFPDDEHTLPLFSVPSRSDSLRQPMAAGDSASPIDIRTSSDSPRAQQAHPVSRPQQPRIDISDEGGMDNSGEQQYRGRQESVGMLGTTPYGARSIPSKDGYRSDGNALSGSLMNGMSWGGISVGSFIRDE